MDYYDYPEGLKARVEELEAYKADIENACKMAMDEKCSLDQKHCTCVPLLRLKVRELDAHIEKLEVHIADLNDRDFAEEAHLSAGENVLLETRIKELEAENKDIRKMLLAGSPPYYEKWQKSQAENGELRQLLWLRHGCQGLYGDDGEMQCGQCMLDFKRDSVEKISQRFTEQGLKQALKGDR